MKKLIIFVLLILTFITISNAKAEEVIIPDNAIRLRIIPNSNTPDDQLLKEQVRNEVQKKLYTLLKNSKNIEEARTLINENITEFEVVVEEVLKENKSEEIFNINFGYNHFPKKIYKGVTYKDGFYESMVITLGKGEGDNWWCVLFPPLCLLEAEETQAKEETEYKFFVKEILDKFFKN